MHAVHMVLAKKFDVVLGQPERVGGDDIRPQHTEGLKVLDR